MSNNGEKKVPPTDDAGAQAPGGEPPRSPEEAASAQANELPADDGLVPVYNVTSNRGRCFIVTVPYGPDESAERDNGPPS